MNKPENTSVLRPLKLIHLALLLGLGFMSLMLTQAGQQPLNANWSGPWFPLIAVAVASCGFSLILSKMFFEKFLESYRGKYPLSHKLTGYRVAYLARLAMLEFAALFCLIVTFLSGSLLTIVLAAGMSVILALQRPSVASITEALQLSREEAAQIT
ncbi:MAG: hypothetical protein IPH78_12530 [Bacteroidetes bacterium]|nr:hypothetical protein [Bacteroidota bacterium]